MRKYGTKNRTKNVDKKLHGAEITFAALHISKGSAQLADQGQGLGLVPGVTVWTIGSCGRRRKECSCFTSKMVPRWCGGDSAADPCPIVRDAARSDIPSFSPRTLSQNLVAHQQVLRRKSFPRPADLPIPKSLLPCDGQRRDGDFPNRVRLVCENEGRVPRQGNELEAGPRGEMCPRRASETRDGGHDPTYQDCSRQEWGQYGRERDGSVTKSRAIVARPRKLR